VVTPRDITAGVRIGLSTPVVIQMPGVSSTWERAAGPDDLIRIAETADQLGFDYLTCPEHVIVPEHAAAERGSTYWDPVATLAFLAARTTRIRLATAVVVLGYHHPLAIAKQYGTLDRLSGGRLILGVGVGSLEAEFDLLNAPFADRGARADDALRALRVSWSTNRPAYRGDYFSYDSVVLDPCAVQERVPMWVGGRTPRSLRRAVTLADGWIPFGLGSRQLASMLAAVDLPAGFDVVLPCGPLDPTGDPHDVRRRLLALQAVGATSSTCTLSADSPNHYCEQLGALHELAEGLEGEGA
jgi:probable F420-dependent oxidoreductase